MMQVHQIVLNTCFITDEGLHLKFMKNVCLKKHIYMADVL